MTALPNLLTIALKQSLVVEADASLLALWREWLAATGEVERLCGEAVAAGFAADCEIDELELPWRFEAVHEDNEFAADAPNVFTVWECRGKGPQRERRTVTYHAATATDAAKHSRDALAEGIRTYSEQALTIRAKHDVEGLDNLVAHAVDRVKELDDAILAAPANGALGFGIKVAIGWLSELAGDGAGSDATGLVVYAINAALADVARLSGIDLAAEFYAVFPQCNPEGK